MAELHWIFDPAPASRARQGGSPIDYIFRHNSLDTFVREVLQNSNDQRTGEGEVDLRFSLVALTGEQKTNFLAAGGWDELLPHLESVASDETVAGRRMQRALEEFSAAPLTLMRISDSGTRGLTGDEDGPGNFTALCKNVLMTGTDRAGRGGSHGLGKAVLTRFSRISTVLFASTLESPEGVLQDRLIGRTILPDHKTSTDSWTGNGWYGAKEEVAHAKRAISVWDDVAREAQSNLMLERPPSSTGTSILIVGFMEPEEEGVRPLNQTVEAILESASRWFWPSDGHLRPLLRVTAEAIQDGTRIFSGTATPDEEQQLLMKTATATEFVERASSPGQVAKRDFVLAVPRRHTAASGGGHEETPATLKLRLTRSDESPGLEEMQNKIALVRGAGMVVRYFDPGRRPLDGKPFYGVLLAGLAAGDGEDDQSLELFLTASEPPAHDEWTHDTDRIRNDYRVGARARLEELWATLRSSVVELCGDTPAPGDHGPRALSRQFPLGGDGGGGPRPTDFRARFSNAHLEDERWSIEGTVTRRADTSRPWRAEVVVSLDSESGPRSTLGLSSARLVPSGLGTADIAGTTAVFHLPQGATEAKFVVVTDEIDDPLLARRTRIHADARAKFTED